MTAENKDSEVYRQFDVLVCTGELLFRGALKVESSQRLLDALNEGVRTSSFLKVTGFLPLENVSVTGSKGGEKKFPSMYIAKNNIVFVAQISGRGEQPQLKNYPFREKLPMRVMAYAAGFSDMQYTFDGRIYVETWGQVIDTVESESHFLPLTQVEIYPAPPGAGSRFDFVALNKQHIISICESTQP